MKFKFIPHKRQRELTNMITRGRGFKNPKRKYNWGGVIVVVVALLAVSIISVLIVQLTPSISDPGQDTPRSPEPGSSAPLLVWKAGDPIYYDDDGSHDLIPLPPISLQQVYYDPFTSKLWYIDDKGVPHEITVMVEVDIGIGFDHEWQAAVGVGGID